MPEQPVDYASEVADDARPPADLDLEMALLAALASRDVGEPTEPVRLDTLTPIDKEVLLQLIRGKLGLGGNSEAQSVAVGAAASYASSDPDAHNE